MTADPYMDAINAGAAALAKPYRDPDTISAFVETFPTIAAARVIDAALPHLRATIFAEQLVPGPCPVEGIIPRVRPDGSSWPLHALCDLRAGHAGQHEADDEQWGHFRWTEEPPLAERCTSLHQTSPEEIVDHNSRVPAMAIQCERTYQHVGYHIAGTFVWDDQLNLLLPHTDETAAPKFLPYTCGLNTMRGSIRGVDGCWINCERLPDHTGWHTKGQIRWNDCGEVVDPYAR